mmetsp:Transcript_27880/g.63016  ORF Transcript_27880/g.63016 Transcript_27880/m.63016 type:complete len:210 (-) Transcript_27880:55-684(-)
MIGSRRSKLCVGHRTAQLARAAAPHSHRAQRLAASRRSWHLPQNDSMENVRDSQQPSNAPGPISGGACYRTECVCRAWRVAWRTYAALCGPWRPHVPRDGLSSPRCAMERMPGREGAWLQRRASHHLIVCCCGTPHQMRTSRGHRASYREALSLISEVGTTRYFVLPLMVSMSVTLTSIVSPSARSRSSIWPTYSSEISEIWQKPSTPG